MKTLKFMLAAATAIGLASATQAAQNTQASTGFEKLPQDTVVVTGLSDNDGNSYFYYTGATAADNESVIAAAPDLTGAQRPTGVTKFTGADLSSRDKVLKVSTGTEPLLRTFAPLSGSAPQAAAAITDDTYVDTLVQFTVTPYTDNVTPGSSDKLMIYLKEMTNSVGEVTGTNLVVVGGYYDESAGEKLIAKEYTINAQVSPNAWYRLTVQAIPNLAKGGLLAGERKYPAFKVYLNGTVCQFDGQTIADNDLTKNFFLLGEYWDDIANQHNVVISMCAASDGSAAATLQAVGFAGEGFVDDLVVTTTDPFNVNIVDFTFNRSGEGVGAVSFTVNGGSAQSSSDTYEVTIGDTITVTAEAQSGYELIAPTFSGLTADPGNTYALATYTVTGTASLTINAQEQQSTPLEPGQQDPTTYATQEAAEAAAAKVTIAASAAVKAALTSEQVTAYEALFETKVVSDGNGGYKVEAGLKATAEADLQDEVDADAAEVIEDLSESTVTLTTTPGFYYSFEYGTTLDGMVEGTRTLATGDTLTLTRPTTANATAGFYKVLVNVTP